MSREKGLRYCALAFPPGNCDYSLVIKSATMEERNDLARDLSARGYAVNLFTDQVYTGHIPPRHYTLQEAPDPDWPEPDDRQLVAPCPKCNGRTFTVSLDTPETVCRACHHLCRDTAGGTCKEWGDYVPF